MVKYMKSIKCGRIELIIGIVLAILAAACLVKGVAPSISGDGFEGDVKRSEKPVDYWFRVGVISAVSVFCFGKSAYDIKKRKKQDRED